MPARPFAAALTIALLSPFAAQAADRRSGFDDMSAETQAMQRDDTANPGMLAVGDGAALWDEPAGPEAKNCSSCHGEASRSMRGVAARYPAWDEATSRPIDLQDRIRQCRAERQQGAPLAHESADLLALNAFVGLQSRGLPTAPAEDARLAPFRERGKAMFEARLGQLGLSCADCHDSNAGKRLAGALIPQGHPNGYPLYRLEWQQIGSLQRRLRNCMTGVRAEPYDFGAAELVELELYLQARAAPLALETPAVRP
jgi:sulfur-oxidizing protein SoxA